jgi:hypothetical protein
MYLIIIIILLIIFYLFILPKINYYSNYEYTNYIEKLDNIINLPLQTVDTNKCSIDCCKFNQWGASNTTLNLGSNFSCNNGNSGGCVCMTQNDLNLLTSRGGNA